jgi:hypothetical protein
MNRRLNMDKIAKALGARRRGKVSAMGGYFGALQLLADIEARFRVPSEQLSDQEVERLPQSATARR